MVISTNKSIFAFAPYSEYIYVEAVSADCAMGKGIAKKFNKEFNTQRSHSAMRYADKVNELYRFKHEGPFADVVYCCDNYGNYITHNILLFTKARYKDKPTLQDMRCALESMSKLILEVDMPSEIPIIMPKVGCGLDKLSWEEVKPIIKDIFNTPEFMNHTIVLCEYNGKDES